MKTSALITLFALLFLSGCSVKESAIKPYNYSLEPIVKLERFNTPNTDVLKVARVDATSGLNSRAILYKKEGAMNHTYTVAWRLLFYTKWLYYSNHWLHPHVRL